MYNYFVRKIMKIAIVGANGYTGYELMRLLGGHGGVEVECVVSVSNVGNSVGSIYPSLTKFGGMIFEDLDFDNISKRCSLVFCCLPHGKSMEVVSEFAKRGLKVIDLSADFRYENVDTYQKIYETKHIAIDLLKKSAYGITEINREKIKIAQIVANPGCYPTCAILPLYPLLKEKAISENNIIIDAKSGVSGAGRRAETAYNFCELDGNFKAYAVASHRHTSEIEEKLNIKATFTPHLLPISRGMLATIYADVKTSAKEIEKIYQKYYKTEPFIKIDNSGATPAINAVKGTNLCSIGYKIDERVNKIIIVSVIDNLTKGASGQAIQNMNIMLGFDESEGLKTQGQHL
jgi:N-acetyl-gamma-glutamyl-phosphate reductase